MRVDADHVDAQPQPNVAHLRLQVRRIEDHHMRLPPLMSTSSGAS
jgi:hypothetical protein